MLSKATSVDMEAPANDNQRRHEAHENTGESETDARTQQSAPPVRLHDEAQLLITGPRDDGHVCFLALTVQSASTMSGGHGSQERTRALHLRHVLSVFFSLKRVEAINTQKTRNTRIVDTIRSSLV